MTARAAVPPVGTVVDVVGLVLRLVLGGVLLVAGWVKVTELPQSRAAVRAYDLLPVDVADFAGTLLPMLEIVLGVLLLSGLLTRAAAVVAGALLLTFIGGIVSAWTRGLSIDCGCFGGGGPVSEQQTRYLTEILRDAGLALCAGWLVVRPRTPMSLDRRLWPS